jgi:hypothetical protein
MLGMGGSRAPRGTLGTPLEYEQGSKAHHPHSVLPLLFNQHHSLNEILKILKILWNRRISSRSFLFLCIFSPQQYPTQVQRHTLASSRNAAHLTNLHQCPNDHCIPDKNSHHPGTTLGRRNEPASPLARHTKCL